MTEIRAAKGEALRDRLFGPMPTAGNNNPRSRQHATLPKHIQEITNDHLFGEVWQNEALRVEERSLITCAILTALGREEQLLGHLFGARNLGISREKLEAMIEHVMYYAGWPVGMTGFRTLGNLWTQIEEREQQ